LTSGPTFALSHWRFVSTKPPGAIGVEQMHAANTAGILNGGSEALSNIW
jgi:hypothetical protein